MSFDLSPASKRLERTRGLSNPIERVRFVAGARSDALKRLGINTVRDLLLHIPTRFLDYTSVATIADTKLSDEVTVLGVVDKVIIKRPHRFVIVEVYITDASGIMRLVYFRQPWIKDQIKRGDILAVSGKVEFSYGFKQMKGPFFEKLGEAASLFSTTKSTVRSGDSRDAKTATDKKPQMDPKKARAEIARKLRETAKLKAIYPLTKGISAQWMRRIMAEALVTYGGMLDYMPCDILKSLHLRSLRWAYSSLHFPHDTAEAEEARRRLAFDELFCLQLALRSRKNFAQHGSSGFKHVLEGPHYDAMIDALPFRLTQEQQQAFDEIRADMHSDNIMNRLLLGDVGTGKTVVAALALALASDSSGQAAVMVPTSVLVRQYVEKVGPLLDKAHISWALLDGSTPARERSSILAALKSGEVTVVFGTHALLADDVAFSRLSLVVVDEQHRFGVAQRARIADKAQNADVLSMSATPIPRTLALALYGDMQTSRIKKRPIQGAGLTTEIITYENIDTAMSAIRDAISQGQQAYVVVSRIDDETTTSGEPETTHAESEQASERKLYSAYKTYDYLKDVAFPETRVGLITGALSAEEKDNIMMQFRSHEIDILVATTVIEVGLDVPNATVMLIYDADRFGLATLHQLRGRVGRGNLFGKVFVASPYARNTAARKRLDALTTTNDGEKLAELDLKIRHEGDILGLKQSGYTTLKLVDFERDKDLVEQANTIAHTISADDPLLAHPLHAALKTEVLTRYPQLLEERTPA